MMERFHIRKGDTVMVVSGNERGKTGKVLEVKRDSRRAIIEGLNVRKKTVRKSQDHPQGGLIEREASMHVSNLMLLDPKTGGPTRIRRERVDGKARRVSVKSGEVIG